MQMISLARPILQPNKKNDSSVARSKWYQEWGKVSQGNITPSTCKDALRWQMDIFLMILITYKVDKQKKKL